MISTTPLPKFTDKASKNVIMLIPKFIKLSPENTVSYPIAWGAKIPGQGFALQGAFSHNPTLMVIYALEGSNVAVADTGLQVPIFHK